ncbi:unnamed protein product [Knipowitschia caucasica]
MSTLEKRTSELETRVGNTEDRMTQLEKAVVYLLQSEAKVAAKCNELEARGRRKNIRIHGVEERAEKNDVVGFVKELIRSKLDLPTGLCIDIERAHRIGSLGTGSNTTARVIIVRFLNYQVKEQVIREAWKQRIVFGGQNIYFNQDYTTEVQKKRRRVRDVIKQLKERNVKAQMLYPAQLRIFSEDGTNRTETFASLKDAASMLRNMGISVVEEDESESEKIRHDILSGNWTLVTSQGQSKGPA